MTFPELLRALRQGWFFVLATTALGIGLGSAATSLTVPQFKATAELYVSVQASESSTAIDIGQANSAAQQKVRSYGDVVTSSRVLQPVIDKLGLGLTPASLASRITTSSPANSVIINITATDSDPARAARIANAISTSFSTIVTGSPDAPVGGGPSLVRIETIQPATTPSGPSSPRATANIALGLVLGMAAGVGLAVLRSLLDTRIRTDGDAAVASRHSVIGTIGFDPGAAKRPLIVHLDPHNPRAESFRALRTNLHFLDAGASARTFLLTSALPSEGKTTTVANLAITLAESGSRVLLIDADLRRPRIAEVMGIEGAVGLTDALIGRAELDDVVQPWGSARLSVLPAGQIPPNPSELLGSRGMQALIETTSEHFDYVIIDSPPVLPVTDAAVLSKLVDGVIVVTASGRSRRPQLERASAALEAIGSRILGVVVTMAPSRGRGRYAAESYAYQYTAREDDSVSRSLGRLPLPRKRST